ERGLVEGLDVAQLVSDLEAGDVEEPLGQGVEHEGVVRIRAVRDADEGLGSRGGHSARRVSGANREWRISGESRMTNLESRIRAGIRDSRLAIRHSVREPLLEQSARGRRREDVA